MVAPASPFFESGCATYGDFYQMAKYGGTALRDRIIDDMTTNETSWFRDAMLWEELRRSVLPRLMESRSSTRRLHLWSAACATGQEPYSLSMVLQEEQSRIAGWDVRILATDFSKAILQRPVSSEYPQIEKNRGVPATYEVGHSR